MTSAAARAMADTGLTVVTLLKRDRARTLVRSAFPRRRAQLVPIKAASDLDACLTRQLIDAVIIDAGLGEDAVRAMARADDFCSVPFVVMTSMLPAEAPVIARASEFGVADILVDGVDDASLASW